MGKKYTNSGKPYMGMRGMDFSNPKAVDKVSMFPKSCMFCQGNTNSKDSICYQCKKDGLHDLVKKNEELMSDKGLQYGENTHYIPTDERLEEIHVGTNADGSAKMMTVDEIVAMQDKRERRKKAWVIKQLMTARDCLGCGFVPFKEAELDDDGYEIPNECTCFGHDEEL